MSSGGVYSGVAVNRLRLRKRYRKYKKQERKKISSDDMILYLKERKIKSWRMLEKTRRPEDPNVNDYRKEFGSWKQAIEAAYGKELNFKLDVEYTLKVVLQLGLWSVEKIQKARKNDPVVIPSWWMIKKQWGSYKNLLEAAKRLDLKGILDQYLRLARQLGRIPTLEDAKNSNLHLEEVMRFYGGKREMDDQFVSPILQVLNRK
jgi:hypothetical protein